ncbi:HAD family hydrolase [Altericista sp. CCNU0014]|uniref:HAD family hydrolase n=1 Tax=Altericista sp. CCNU0014 TaxID=3082949 RepID=UPI00384CADA6
MIEAVLFDLDGTLSDPKVGITRSIQFALSALNCWVPEQDDLLWCIGPPLRQCFAQLLQTSDSALIDRAINLYRDRFSSIGLFENDLYPEIPSVLRALREFGYQCFVATSKPQVFARQIIEHFQLTSLLDGIYGSELDGTRSDKGELIQHILQVEQRSPQICLMVGDRSHDMIGAKRNRLATIGVTYGYGTAAELTAHGADYLAHNPKEIISVFESFYSKP